MSANSNKHKRDCRKKYKSDNEPWGNHPCRRYITQNGRHIKDEQQKKFFQRLKCFIKSVDSFLES